MLTNKELEEYINKEAVKCIIKLAIINDNSLTLSQKRYALDRVDVAAMQADTIKKILDAFGII